LATAEAATIQPGKIIRIPTGLVVETPPGYMLMVASRSSTPRSHGVMIPQGIGIVDQDYSGDTDELLLQVHNFTAEAVTIPAGTRIAQAGFVRVDQAELVETAETMSAARGGFGSTG
jgi:dUTP pyrophosphatase